MEKYMTYKTNSFFSFQIEKSFITKIIGYSQLITTVSFYKIEMKTLLLNTINFYMQKLKLHYKR